MRKNFVLSFVMVFLALPLLAFGQDTTAAQQRSAFKARRKQINKLVRQYKKAPAQEQPVLKAQLEELVSKDVDDGVNYMKQYVAQERARLDNWEKKIKTHEDNLPKLKEQYVEDLLTGNAKKKHRQAKKEWKVIDSRKEKQHETTERYCNKKQQNDLPRWR